MMTRSVARPLKLGLFYGALTALGASFLLPYVLAAFASLKPINEIFPSRRGSRLPIYTCTTMRTP